MQDFGGKVAVITGGASGVGRSLAFALGRRGAKIAVGDVDKNAMARVREDLAAESVDCIVEFCDVTSVQSLTDLADKAEAAFGSIDLVFANAGIGAGVSRVFIEGVSVSRFAVQGCAAKVGVSAQRQASIGINDAVACGVTGAPQQGLSDLVGRIGLGASVKRQNLGVHQ